MYFTEGDLSSESVYREYVKRQLIYHGKMVGLELSIVVQFACGCQGYQPWTERVCDFLQRIQNFPFKIFLVKIMPFLHNIRNLT